MDFFKFFNFRFSLKRKYRFILLIFVVSFIIWNILSMLGYCSSSVSLEPTLDTSLYINGSSVIVSKVENPSSNNLWYIYVPSSGTVTISSSTSTTRYYYKSDLLDVGTVLTRLGTVPANSSVNFKADSPGYILVNAQSINQFSAEFVSDSSMSNAIGGLISGLPSSDLWGVVTKSLPFVLVVVLVSFGSYIINKNVDKLSRGGSSLDNSPSKKGYYNKKKGYYYNPSAAARAKARGKSRIKK